MSQPSRKEHLKIRPGERSAMPAGIPVRSDVLSYSNSKITDLLCIVLPSMNLTFASFHNNFTPNYPYQ